MEHCGRGGCSASMRGDVPAAYPWLRSLACLRGCRAYALPRHDLVILLLCYIATKSM